MARVCILCETPGPLTGEHVWSDWYSEDDPGIRYLMEADLPGRKPFTREAPSLDTSPKVLCATCNNVWGSQLDGRVSRFLGPMTMGLERKLTLKRMEDLAVWATLKFMVAERVSGSGRPTFFTQEQRSALRRQTRPLIGTGLWIGRYVGTHHWGGRFTDGRSVMVLSDDVSEEREYQSYVVTYSIGQILIQFIGFSDAEELARVPNLRLPVRVHPEWGQALMKFWPLPQKAVRWPPPIAFKDVDFLQLHRRWGLDERTPRRGGG